MSGGKLTGAFDSQFSGSIADSCVAVLAGDLSQLLCGSYLGGFVPTTASANGIAADALGGLVVVGSPAQGTFSATPGAYDTTYNGGGIISGDGYVVHLPIAPAWQTLGGTLGNGLSAVTP